MMDRIVEVGQNEAFSSPEQARQYAEQALQGSKTRYRSFLRRLRSLDIQGRCLDVGAGPGVLAMEVAQQHPTAEVVALEPSPEMVGIGRSLVEQSGLNDRIRFVEGGVHQHEILASLGTYDLVYCCFSLHHFTEAEPALRSLLGCVAAGGTLVLYDLKRVWWLYWVPVHSGFFDSIRASYLPAEIREMMRHLGVEQYQLQAVLPYFMQSLVIHKAG